MPGAPISVRDDGSADIEAGLGPDSRKGPAPWITGAVAANAAAGQLDSSFERKKLQGKAT